MLSDDVLSEVFRHLHLSDILECSGLCHRWRNIALHEIFRRTNQPSTAIISKHKHLNKSNLLRIVSRSNKKFSLKSLFQKIRFSAALIPGDCSGQTFCSDFDLYPSVSVSMRWYSFPINLKPGDLEEYRWCLTTPLLSPRELPPRQYTVSRGSQFSVTSPHSLTPVVVDKLITLYNTGTTVLAVWNDFKTVAFLVHTQPLSLRFLADSFYLKLPEKTIRQHAELDNFGITALLTLRNFKRVFVHEVFSNLFYESDNVIRGWDKVVLQSISLNKEFSLLWRSDYFKGRIQGCCIVELVLKHSKTFTSDNLWDVSKYFLSQLCKLEPLPDEYRDKIPFNFSPDSSFIFRASNQLLSLEIILCFDSERDELIFHDMNISIQK